MSEPEGAAPPYDPDDNYPFIDIGNRYVIKDALYSPAVLAGMTWRGSPRRCAIRRVRSRRAWTARRA